MLALANYRLPIKDEFHEYFKLRVLQKIKVKNVKLFTVLIVSLILISGCSTLTGEGTAQAISLETIERASMNRITDARCDLSNDEVAWTVLTLGSVMVHRSNKPLSVKCQKSGYI